MSFRASLVDDFIAESTINALVDTRVFDMFFEFEDFLNSKANAISSFPAITIESDSGDTENNLGSHDNLKFETLSITIYQQVNLQKLRSRRQSVRDAERDIKRQVDTVADAVTAYILDKRGVIDASYYIRASHISNDSDGISETEGNREIITREISYVVTYSDFIPVSVNLTIPVVTGDVAVDDLLTTTDGTWTNSPTSFTYRWLRDDVAISGATASTYTIVSADEETTIKSEVTAINPGGSSLPAESVGTEIPSGEITRFLTPLDPALTQHYTLDSTVTLTANFTYECSFSSTNLIGNSLTGNDGNSYIFFQGATTLYIKTGVGSNISYTIPDIFGDGREHTFKAVRTSGSVELFFDGVSYGTGNATNSGTFLVGFIGADKAVSGNYFDGVISDVKITDAGVLAHHWKLDENFGITSTAVDSVIQPEEITNGDFSNGDTAWSLASDAVGTAVVTGEELVVTGGANFAHQSGVLESGKTYAFSFDYTESAIDGFRIRTDVAGTGANDFQILSLSGTGSGTISGTFTATGADFWLQAANAIFTGTIDNIQVKLSFDATAQNIVASEFVTQQEARNYTNYDGVADHCTIPTATLPDNFTYECDFASTNLVGNSLMGGDTNSYIHFFNATTLFIKTGVGNNISYTIPDIFNDGRLHKIKADRVGSDVELSFSGTSYGTGNNTNSGTFLASFIAADKPGAGNFFDGITANNKITDDNGDLIRNYEGKESYAVDTDLIDTGTDGLDGTAVSITSANVSKMASWLTASSGAILIAEQA